MGRTTSKNKLRVTMSHQVLVDRKNNICKHFGWLKAENSDLCLEVWFVAGLLGKNVSNRSADVCMHFLLDNQDFYCDFTGSFSGGFPFQWHSQFNWGSPGWFWMSAVVLNTTEWEWTNELYIYIKSKVQQCSGIKFQKSIVLLHTPHKKEHLLCRMSNLCEQPWLFRVYRG